MARTAATKPTVKLNNIQGLRAFAAVAVVVFHTGFAFPTMRPFGSFGVDVFFVISGYIMARILDPESDSSSDFFFRRRVLRIVPPYWLFTLLLFVVALKVPLLMGSTRATAVDLGKSLLFIPFTKGSGVIQPLLFIGWSLNYEMFFYLALAVGLLIHKRWVKRVQPSWIGAALVVATMLVCLPFAERSVLAKFYSRELVLEFLLGIVSYYFCRAVSESEARRWRGLALAVCALSGLWLIAVQAWLPDWHLSRLLVLGIAALLMVTSASVLSQGGWDTRAGWLVLIGDASYVLYLIHPYCEYSLDRFLGARVHWLQNRTASGMVIGVGLSIGLAVVLHVYGERPMVRWLNRNFGGKRRSAEFESLRAAK